MWWYDPEASSRNRECPEAGHFRRLAHDSILAFLTESTTPHQYQQALDSLAALKDDHIRRLDAFHTSAFYGRHRCISDAFAALRLHILNTAALKPVPQPDPAPAPPPDPPRKSLKQVLEQFERQGELYLGDRVETEEEE
jgi:hypothetical protein